MLMADRTVNGLRGCISSLRMTVGPCVEQTGDSLAREQAALMARYLNFALQRLDLIGDRVRFELDCYVDMAGDVADALNRQGHQPRELVALRDRAAATLASPAARQVELEAISAALRTEISRIVRSAAVGRPASRAAVDAAVVARSRALIEFQRSWFAPQAWESDADHLPDVEALIAASRN
jgi:hypothetical protein